MTYLKGFYKGGFYTNIFYKKSLTSDKNKLEGSCFVPLEQKKEYRGFLFQVTELRSNYQLHI